MLDGQTLREIAQCMEQEQNLGVKIRDIREPKLEEVEQKSFKKGTGEGVLQAGFHSALWHRCIPCKYAALIAFPHHLCGQKRTLCLLPSLFLRIRQLPSESQLYFISVSTIEGRNCTWRKAIKNVQFLLSC